MQAGSTAPLRADIPVFQVSHVRTIRSWCKTSPHSGDTGDHGCGGLNTSLNLSQILIYDLDSQCTPDHNLDIGIFKIP